MSYPLRMIPHAFRIRPVSALTYCLVCCIITSLSYITSLSKHMPRHVAAVYMKSPGAYGVLVTESDECPVSLRVVSEYQDR